jgi:hypothetical protein
MGEGKISHRSSSSMVRGRNLARRRHFFRRGGATVAGGGPATVRRERKVSSTLHGRETTRGRLGRRSPWMKLATAEDSWTATGFGHGDGAASDSGDGAVRTGRCEARQFRQQRRRGRNGAALSGRRRTACGPNSAFNARARYGAWQPRFNGALPGRPGTDSCV